ncbi:MAG: ankyrin repeat domain-containing protein [Sphingomicrobium sp.]
MMKRKILIRLASFALAASAMSVTLPATAQLGGNNGEDFLTAVREVDGNKATELLNRQGSTVLSHRGGKGETALNIVARRRDSTWLGFLLGRGADPNVGDDRGETPLLIAARLGWEDGVSLLLGTRAAVDRANRFGETALIVAVQARQPGMVRLLLQNGANPDKKDTAAGYSARDYARRDSRSTELIRLIESVKPGKKIIAGPVFK